MAYYRPFAATSAGLVWVVIADRRRLGESLMQDLGGVLSQGEAVVSAATFWELEVKRRRTRRGLPPIKDLRSKVIAAGLREARVSGSLWLEAVGLVDEGFHSDPADQLIVATAIGHGHEFITMDRRIRTWAERSGRVALR